MRISDWSSDVCSSDLGLSALYLRLPVGYRVGMNSTMGRAYLASLSASERMRIIQALEPGLVSPKMMSKACREFKSSGCCFGIGDWKPGIHAVAAPFATLTGEGALDRKSTRLNSST